MLLLSIVLGSIMNRCRGSSSVPLGKEINALSFGIFFGYYINDNIYMAIALTIACRLAFMTGWTEMLVGGTGKYELSENEDYNWISSIVKPTNQFTTWLYGCIRAFIIVLPIYLGFMAFNELKIAILLFIPLFYPMYRLNYLIAPTKYFWLAECLVGGLLWGLCFF